MGQGMLNWVQILVLPLSSGVTLGKLLAISATGFFLLVPTYSKLVDVLGGTLGNYPFLTYRLVLL